MGDVAGQRVGGFEPVVGLEAGDVAMHDADDEYDDRAAVAGLLTDYPGEPSLEGVGPAGNGLPVFGPHPFYGRPADRQEALSSERFADIGVSIPEQVLVDEPWGDLADLVGGGHPVVVPEAVELSAGDVKVELDDGLAIVGLLADDVGEGPLLLYGCGAVIAHRFYAIGRTGVLSRGNFELNCSRLDEKDVSGSDSLAAQRVRATQRVAPTASRPYLHAAWPAVSRRMVVDDADGQPRHAQSPGDGYRLVVAWTRRPAC